MQTEIQKVISEQIGKKKEDWALMYVVRKNQERFDTPEAKKEVDAATHRMGQIEDELDFLQKLSEEEADK
jgi:sulfur relay (sulfurtransferase) DsrC/TusE family protein